MEYEELEQIWKQECQESLAKQNIKVECSGLCSTCIIHKGFDAMGKLKDQLYMMENYGVR